VQVSSQNDTLSILSVARQSALAKSSKDNGNESGGSFQTAMASGGLSFSQGYTSSQNSLGTMDMESADAATTKTLTGAEEIVANEGGLMLDALTQSDWDLIEKTTGLIFPNDKTGNWLDADGNVVSSGAAYEQAGAMVFAMADMRIYAAQFGTAGDMFSGTGDITPAQLQEYFAKYQQGSNGQFSAEVLQELDNALIV
jgi:hypothetical protein